ncbi:hypothetical protein [Agriterribacter sp.]|uniref:hypothetical protein n=1 Tax=Agriterribacter sp. TaxID=2821509 RepID=UPI002C40F5FD|nr:hypothetical protein [Agriterribacter sp.]HTN08726.1 hypothetical protein [Agriterribacter sp.]
MKKNLVSIIAFMLLTLGMIACKKDNTESVDPEKQNEEIKTALTGKWQREHLSVKGYKDGQLIEENITNEVILTELQKEIPYYFEFTKNKFILIGLDGDGPKEQSYTVDAKTHTIVLTDDSKEEITEDDITRIRYELSKNNNELIIIVIFEEDFGNYNTLHVTVKLKRVSAFG